MNDTINIYAEKEQQKNNISTVVKELIAPKLKGTVLDVGFGNGDYLEYFSSLGHICEGLDGSSKNVEKMSLTRR